MDFSKGQENWMKHWGTISTLMGNQQSLPAGNYQAQPIQTINPFSGQDHLGIEHPISLLPISMKIAAKTIGMDLVSVQPLSGPIGQLNYMDYDVRILQDHLGVQYDIPTYEEFLVKKRKI